MIIEVIFEEIKSQLTQPQLKMMDPLEKLTNFKLKILFKLTLFRSMKIYGRSLNLQVGNKISK